MPLAGFNGVVAAEINQEVIASRLDISRTTVSRCFTNHKGINPKTRARVFSLAAKLGYQYLQPRSGHKNSAKGSVGILICSDVEEFNRSDYESPGLELLPGISEFAQLQNWQTEIHFVSPLAGDLADPSYAKIQAIKKRLFSGLILMYPFAPKVIEELNARLPCVSLVEQYGPVAVDCVDVNHYKGIAALMARLRKHGHSRIGFFSRKYAIEAAWSYRRYSAFVENLARLKIPYNARDVIELDSTSPRTAEAGYRLVVDQMKDGVTAWMCAADYQAYDLINALTERGYQVPRDVSVTGFDGILRPLGAPVLDTIRIPYYEIGFAASRRLYDKMNKRFDSPQEILLEGRLQEGETITSPIRVH